MEKTVFAPIFGAITFEIFDETLFRALAKSEEQLHLPLIVSLSFPQEKSDTVLQKTVYIQKIFPQNTCNLSASFKTAGAQEDIDWDKRNFDLSFSFLMEAIIFPKVWFLEGYIHQRELDDTSEKMPITILYLPDQERGSFAFHSKNEIPWQNTLLN
jgi:hypothetical protein